jgi:hypothetical protein
MDDKKSLKVVITNLSARRKLALALALLVIGGGISDIDAVNDTDISVSATDADAGAEGFDEIEAMVTEFESAKIAESTPAVTAPDFPDAAPPFVNDNIAPPTLTIPQATDREVPVRNVSYPGQKLPRSTPQETAAATGELRAVTAGSTAAAMPPPTYQQRTPLAKTSIRLTGSIFPSP